MKGSISPIYATQDNTGKQLEQGDDHHTAASAVRPLLRARSNLVEISLKKKNLSHTDSMFLKSSLAGHIV